MFASLAAVLGLFVAVTWFLKRGTPAGMLNLPKDAFEVYGRAPLNARQQVQLVRLGQRLLWVAVSTNGVQTLTEVTDPLEVERLSKACRRDARPAAGRPRGKIAAALQGRQPSAPRHLDGLYADDEFEIAESRHA